MTHLKIKNNLRLSALSLIIAYLIFFSACLNDSQRRIAPKAVNGVLDLTDWDLKIDGPVDLSGEWEFYWQQHLMPQDFTSETAIRKTGFIEVPGYWKGYEIDGKKLPGYGYATYRLIVLLNKQQESLALRTVEITNAYTIYVDGHKVSSLGKAGKNRESTVPRQYPQIADFEPKTNQIEFIFHVSNYHHRRGGIWEVIQLGTEKDMLNAKERRLSFDLFLVGSIFLVALYHLKLFIFRKDDRAPLYFSFFCFLTVLRSVTTGGRYLILLFPGISWELMVKLEYLSFYLAVPAFGMFMQSLFPKISEKFILVLKMLAIAFSCIVVFTPARFYTHPPKSHRSAF